MTAGLDRYRLDREREMTARVAEVIRALDRTGEAVSVARVAREAGVSRQWLYGSPFRDEILNLRSAAPRPGARPARERGSEASLRAQNEALRQRLKDVRDENAALRTELARALGRLREQR